MVGERVELLNGFWKFRLTFQIHFLHALWLFNRKDTFFFFSLFDVE